MKERAGTSRNPILLEKCLNRIGHRRIHHPREIKPEDRSPVWADPILNERRDFSLQPDCQQRKPHYGSEHHMRLHKDNEYGEETAHSATPLTPNVAGVRPASFGSAL